MAFVRERRATARALAGGQRVARALGHDSESPHGAPDRDGAVRVTRARCFPSRTTVHEGPDGGCEAAVVGDGWVSAGEKLVDAARSQVDPTRNPAPRIGRYLLRQGRSCMSARAAEQEQRNVRPMTARLQGCVC